MKGEDQSIIDLKSDLTKKNRAELELDELKKNTFTIHKDKFLQQFRQHYMEVCRKRVNARKHACMWYVMYSRMIIMKDIWRKF